MDSNYKPATALRLLPLVAALLAVCATAFGARHNWEQQAAQRKADYIFLESQACDVEGQHDAAFELLRRAHSLNPTDTTVGYQYGTYLLMLSSNDSVQFPKAVRLIKEYCQRYPDDSYAASLEASIYEYVGDVQGTIRCWERMHRYQPDNLEIALQLAMALASDHSSEPSLRRSVALMDTILAVEDDIEEIHINRMKILYWLGDTARILSDVRGFINKGRAQGDADQLVRAGTVYHRLDLDSLALATLIEACRMDSTSGSACYSLAQLYLEMGDTVAYERETYEAMLKPSLDPDVKIELLHTYITDHINDTESGPRISRLLAALEEQHPHEAAVHNIYASYLAHIGDYEQAAQQQQHSLDLDPSQVGRWKLLVTLLESAEQYTPALTAVDRALTYFPTDAELYASRAFIVLEEDIACRPADAYDMLDSALTYTPEADYQARSALIASKGDVAQRFKSEHKNVAKYYDEALEIYPDNALALNNYAYFLATNDGDLDRAQQMVERSLELEPQNINALDTYAWVMFQKKDYPRAREIFDSAIDEILSATDATAEGYDHAGDIYFMTGDHDQALEYWKKALEIEPDNAEIKRKVVNKAYFAK